MVDSSEYAMNENVPNTHTETGKELNSKQKYEMHKNACNISLKSLNQKQGLLNEAL